MNDKDRFGIGWGDVQCWMRMEYDWRFGLRSLLYRKKGLESERGDLNLSKGQSKGLDFYLSL